MVQRISTATSHFSHSQAEIRELSIERDFSARAFLFLLVHLPLGVFFQWNPIFPTIHALGVLGLGVLWLFRDQTPHRVILIIAYVAGAEILWRGTNANIFYEYGKYACILLLSLAILRYRQATRMPKWPFIYFMLLIPSIFVIPEFDREAISFNIAGPLALAAASIFFHSQVIDKPYLRKLLIAWLAPILALAGLVVFGIITAINIDFSTNSNFQTSAEFGPNQVSSMLGLGAMFAFLLMLIFNRRFTILRFLFLGLMVWLIFQSMLTFSRGGFWTAIGAMVVGGYFLFQNARSKTVFITTSLAFVALGYFVLLPALNNFTDNTLRARFQDFDTTGRIEIIVSDWSIFLNHPILGVGPNQSKTYHALNYRYASAHTEFSRLLSEHGLFGVIALFIMLRVSVDRLVRKGTIWEKTIITMFTTWALLFMSHSATRIVAPSLLFGIASARFFLDNQSAE